MNDERPNAHLLTPCETNYMTQKDLAESGGVVSSTAWLERIAYVLYLETWTNTDEDVADLTDEHLKSLGEKWRKEWLPGRYSEHCGDCTNVPMACHRCIMDELFKNAERILRSNNDYTNSR